MTRLMSFGVVFAVGVCVATPAADDRSAPRIRIAVMNTKDAQGYVDPKDVDSLNDLTHALHGCSVLRTVPPEPKAVSEWPQLLLFASRAVDETDGALPIYYESLHAMISVLPITPLAESEHRAPYIKLIYKVGGYGGWRYAAKQVVDELCDWVKANRARIED